MLDFLFGPWFTSGGYLILVAGAVGSIMVAVVVTLFRAMRGKL